MDIYHIRYYFLVVFVISQMSDIIHYVCDLRISMIYLKTTYFLFEDKIYTHVEGVAMESPVSPIVGNLFMEWLMRLVLDPFMFAIRLWKRYLDHTMVILSGALVEDFMSHMNNIHQIALMRVHLPSIPLSSV